MEALTDGETEGLMLGETDGDADGLALETASSSSNLRHVAAGESGEM